MIKLIWNESSAALLALYINRHRVGENSFLEMTDSTLYLYIKNVSLMTFTIDTELCYFDNVIKNW